MPPPPVDERTRLAAKLVSRNWPDLEYSRTSVPDPGMDHAVIVLHQARQVTDAGNGDALELGDLVIRAPLTSDYQAQSAAEADVLDDLRRVLSRASSNVRIPRPVLRTSDGTIGAQTFVEGEALTKDVWRSLSAEQRNVAIEQFAELLAALHTRHIDTAPFNAVEPWWLPTEHRELTEAVQGEGLGRATLNVDSPRALPAKAAKVADAAPRLVPAELSDPDRDIIAEIIRDVSDVLKRPFAPRLVHSDLYDAHALWNGHSLGVIDFSDMNRGDPAIDFAHFTDLDDHLADEVLARARTTIIDGVAPAYDEHILDRAWVYKRWDAVFLLIDHLRTGFTPAELAWEAFAAARPSRRPGAR